MAAARSRCTTSLVRPTTWRVWPRSRTGKDGTRYNFHDERVLVYVADGENECWRDSDTATFADGWIQGCGGTPACFGRAAQEHYFKEYFEGDDDGEFHRHVANLLELESVTA